MDAVRATTLVSPAEFRQLNLPEDREWELHEGEIIEMTFPRWVHRALQQRIELLLLAALPHYKILVEMPFEAGSNIRSADVGVIALDRDSSAATEGILTGAPLLAVEVLSPSKRPSQPAVYRKLCFTVHKCSGRWTPKRKRWLLRAPAIRG